MDSLLKLAPDWVKELPSYMDYEGQKRAERTFQVIIVLFAVVGFTWGYICQQFSQTMYILAAGFVLSCALTLPPWPMYRVKPLEWQKARPLPNDTEGTPAAGSAQGKGKKRK